MAARAASQAVAVLGLAAALLLPAAGLSGFWLFFLCLVGINAILTTSLNLAMGVTGLVSLVHTGLYATGAYLSALAVSRLGLSFWVALPVAVLGAATLGAAISLATLRASHLYFAMITMAFNLILQEIAQGWDGVTGGVVGLFGVPRPIWAGRSLDTTEYYYLVVGAVTLSLLFVRQVMRSAYGRAFRAVKLSEEAAMALGINPLASRALSFTLSAGLAGLAGALFVHLNGFVSPAAAGLEGSLILYVALLLGGPGTLAGPLLGVGFVSVVQKLIQPWAQYQQFIFGAILLLVMVVLPRGLLGTLYQIGRRWVESIPVVAGAVWNDPKALLSSRFAEHTLSSSPIVTVQGVRKRFGGVEALRGVSIQVQTGTVHGLIGPNGSGKSTLVGVVTGYLRAEKGSVALFGRAASLPAYVIASMGVARVFQLPHLFSEMTVLDNLLAGFHVHARQRLWHVALGLPSFYREERVLSDRARALLRTVGLEHVALHPAGRLPYGQQRLIEILRALALEPRLLILDEPTTGLTVSEQARLKEMLLDLREAGVTILLIEHNMPFVMQLSDRITVLVEGNVLAEGTPEEIQSNPAVIGAYLGIRKSDEGVAHA